MATIFQSQNGRVTWVNGVTGVPQMLSIVSGVGQNLTTGAWVGMQPLQSTVLLDKYQMTHDANVQFMPTLKNVIYIYSFGERLVRMNIQGMAFLSTCASAASYDNGFNTLLSFYKKQSAAGRVTPLTVNIGQSSSALTCFLIGMDHSVEKADIGLIRFNLRFVTLPV